MFANSPSIVSARVVSAHAVQTLVSLNTTDGMSAYCPSLRRATVNFGVRWTLVNRSEIPPKRSSAFARALALDEPNAGATLRHAEIESTSAAAVIIDLVEERITGKETSIVDRVFGTPAIELGVGMG